MSNDDSASADGKRRPAIRFPAQTETVEVISRLTARVTDESKTGIGLVVDNPASFVVGQAVEVEYNGVRMKATVRRIVGRPEGSHVVGLEWR